MMQSNIMYIIGKLLKYNGYESKRYQCCIIASIRVDNFSNLYALLYAHNFILLVQFYQAYTRLNIYQIN